MASKDKKWAFLRGRLPLANEDPTYDEVIAALRREYEGQPIVAVVEAWNAAEEFKAALKQNLSELDARIVACERVMLEHLIEDEMESVTLAGVTLSRKPEPVITTTDKAALRAWAAEHMPDNLALHSSTLAAVVKDALLNGQELPAGVEVTELRETLSRRTA